MTLTLNGQTVILTSLIPRSSSVRVARAFARSSRSGCVWGVFSSNQLNSVTYCAMRCAGCSNNSGRLEQTTIYNNKQQQTTINTANIDDIGKYKQTGNQFQLSIYNVKKGIMKTIFVFMTQLKKRKRKASVTT